MWHWTDVKRAIHDSHGSFQAFLKVLPRSEIERLIYSNDHWCNVCGFFEGTNGDRAREIYDEVRRRALDRRA
jgi:hypothetical protein